MWLANDGAFWSDRRAFSFRSNPFVSLIIHSPLGLGALNLPSCSCSAATACCWGTTTGKGGGKLSCSAAMMHSTPTALHCISDMMEHCRCRISSAPPGEPWAAPHTEFWQWRLAKCKHPWHRSLAGKKKFSEFSLLLLCFAAIP